MGHIWPCWISTRQVGCRKVRIQVQLTPMEVIFHEPFASGIQYVYCVQTKSVGGIYFYINLDLGHWQAPPFHARCRCHSNCNDAYFANHSKRVVHFAVPGENHLELFAVHATVAHHGPSENQPYSLFAPSGTRTSQHLYAFLQSKAVVHWKFTRFGWRLNVSQYLSRA